jgi:hypothetical protein
MSMPKFSQKAQAQKAQSDAFVKRMPSRSLGDMPGSALREPDRITRLRRLRAQRNLLNRINLIWAVQSSL